MNINKQKFMKIYAGLPSASRDEVMVVVEGEPFTWKSARLEIENDSSLGDTIINILLGLGILQ